MPPLDCSDASFDLIPCEPTALPAGQQSAGGNFADRDRVLHRHVIPAYMEEVRMGIPIAAERRLLSEDELGPVARSHYPELESLSRDQLIELARWLRSRRARARDIVHHRRRVSRGKAEPRNPAADTPSERGLAAKKQVFSHSLRRVNARLNRLLAEEKHAGQRARLPAADHAI